MRQYSQAGRGGRGKEPGERTEEEDRGKSREEGQEP